jgi:hypothetical protein
VIRIKHYIGKLSRIKSLKVTTDKLAAYKNALQSVFTDIDYVYLQIVKKRVKMRLVTVKKCFVKGTEDDFKGKTQADGHTILASVFQFLCSKALSFDNCEQGFFLTNYNSWNPLA